MKNLCCLFLTLLLFASCASKNMDSQKDIKLAVATQRLGGEYYNSGNYTAALKTLLKAQETIPDDPYLNNSLGLVYLAKKRYKLAEESFKKALTEKPDYIRAKNNLGVAYLKQEKWDLAIACFKEVSENILYATPEMPLSNLGWVYFHQRMYKRARSYFQQSLNINPDFLSAVHGISSIYIKTGDYTRALNFLHSYLKKNPGAAILHSDLAKAYEALKDYKQAKKSWELVLELAPPQSHLAR
ncbi:MAG: tetratricopeptide repeat protein, partial [Thermodesulfobacteriota bacterium]